MVGENSGVVGAQGETQAQSGGEQGLCLVFKGQSLT